MKRIAVIRGGPSNEYAISMRTGGAILDAIRTLDLPYKDVVITKQGEWLDGGIPRSPEKVLHAVDVVFIALHGTYGEDGQIQRIMHRLGIPYTGSRSLPSAIAFNKHLTKETLSPLGIKTPKSKRVVTDDVVDIEALITELNATLGEELFIKPVADGSSFGATKIPDGTTLCLALPRILDEHPEILIEEYINGREATVGLLEDFRGQRHYVLPVIELVPPAHAEFYDMTVKYNGETVRHCPGRFSKSEKEALAELAVLAHTTLGLSQYSRTDFIIKDGVPYFLEVNTLPGFTATSNFPAAAAAVGLSFPQLVAHLIDTATL